MTQLTIAQCLKLTDEISSVSDTARLDIELLLSHLLQESRTWLFTWSDQLLTSEQTNQFQQLLSRRKKGEPIAHIVGQREFWSLPLQVNNSTLIPRPDTELLVEQVLDVFSGDESHINRSCLDLGTGTGAIVLALASEKKFWNFIAVDRSPDAVILAKTNCQQLGFTNVQILQSDWFDSIPPQTFDVIVSNPPYIDSADPHLSQGDVIFEPRSALVAENHGLADIKKIIIESRRWLKDSGWLCIEHGFDQAEAVQKLFSDSGYSNIQSRKDLGGNDRITFGQL